MSYIYWWFESDLPLIKIGYGDRPHERLNDYSKKWRLNPDKRSLVSHYIGDRAREVESYLHRRMRGEGYNRRAGNECFLIKGRSREHMTAFLRKELANWREHYMPAPPSPPAAKPETVRDPYYDNLPGPKSEFAGECGWKSSNAFGKDMHPTPTKADQEYAQWKSQQPAHPPAPAPQKDPPSVGYLLMATAVCGVAVPGVGAIPGVLMLANRFTRWVKRRG